MTPVRLPIRTPLVCVQTAKAVLGVSEDKVLGLVESGRLVAWDLRAHKVRRSLLRILTQSLRLHADGQDGRLTPAQVMLHVLPGSSAAVPSSRLAWTWGVSSTHVTNLIRAGCLQPAGKRVHEKASLPVYRKSIVAFMEARSA